MAAPAIYPQAYPRSNVILLGALARFTATTRLRQPKPTVAAPTDDDADPPQVVFPAPAKTP